MSSVHFRSGRLGFLPPSTIPNVSDISRSVFQSCQSIVYRFCAPFCVLDIVTFAARLLSQSCPMNNVVHDFVSNAETKKFRRRCYPQRMRPTAIDDSVARCVRLSVTRLRNAKTTQRIEVLIGLQTFGDPENILLYGGRDSPTTCGRLHGLNFASFKVYEFVRLNSEVSSLHRIWKDKRLSVVTKTRLFCVLVLSILLYVSKIWLCASLI